ncbi:MAG TPA: hypothetical protein VMM36_04680 [Opitutaceae bacterium]|nr:hypothetical protein [Opitutaceae bacterium]
MTEASISAVQQILHQVRTELVDKAYELESQRRMDAADVAIAAAARVEELSRAVGEFIQDEEPALTEQSGIICKDFQS